MPDRELPLNDTLTVDVSQAFTDPYGDALAYAVSSSTPHVATLLVAGVRVTVTAVGLGRATISVTATDAGGLGAAQTFTMTVNSAENRPPEPVGALPPLALGVDGPGVAVEAVGAFRDPDGDRLTYGAVSSAPSVAAVSVLGSTVTVTPTGEGAATVRSRIDALRAGTGLGRFAWTDPVLRPGVTPVRDVHLLELREALSEAYASSGRAVPRWTDASLASGSTRSGHCT